MSGGKSEGQLISLDDPDGEGDNENRMRPDASNLNFAVPDVSVLRDFRACSSMKNSSLEVSPGIIEDTIDMKAKGNKNVSYILSVDGKKVAPGLTESGGDEDLFGHENPKLDKRKEPLQEDLDAIEALPRDDNVKKR